MEWSHESIVLTRAFFARNLWLRSAGRAEVQPEDEIQALSVEALKRTEWSPRFEREMREFLESPVTQANPALAAGWSVRFEVLMRGRLVQGAYRYGRLGAPCKPHYCRVDGALKRMFAYKQDGNDELLVDVANLCLLEFVEGGGVPDTVVDPDNIVHIVGAWSRVGMACSLLDRCLRRREVARLVAVACLCMQEFELGDHPKKHFKMVGDTDHAYRVDRRG